jgi:flagellin-like hook-associated protein FlgL
MSSVIKLQQRLAELSKMLTQENLSEDDRDDIEAEIEEIEYQMDKEFNAHDHEDDY